jgi:hypothetical protein
VSCNTISKEEFAKTIPVKPPNVNKKINPRTHKRDGVKFNQAPCRVANHLKTLTPVGTAITIVIVVK